VNPRAGRPSTRLPRPLRALRAAVALVAALLVLLAGQVLVAGPVFAHAELVSSSPANGQQLSRAPDAVTMRFTERVGLIGDRIRLIDTTTRKRVPTPEPVAEGSTIRLPLPGDLPDGAYLVTWRVVSADSHPISGAFSFGVGRVRAAPVPEGGGVLRAPWPLPVVRWIGYLGFALVAGVVAFVALCWPGGRSDRRPALLLQAGLQCGAAATLAGLLLQGPYLTAEPLSHVFDPSLMGQVAHTTFGAWTQLRLLLYLAMAGVLWRAGALERRADRCGAALGVVALAVTFPGTGHAAASGHLLDPVVDGAHLLAAGVWVGGLATLAVLSWAPGPRPSADAWARFSRLALASVLVVVTTGTINAVLRLDAFDQLWGSAYGQVLLVKLALVAVALAGAAVSRRRVAGGLDAWRSVRFEAAGTVAVLAVTAVLGLTAPPPDSGPGSPSAQSASATRRTTVRMELGQGRHAELGVEGLGTTGSTLSLSLYAADRSPLQARRISLSATLPDRDLGPIDVPLRRDAAGWSGSFTFPFAGRWRLNLTVAEHHLGAVVTAGSVGIE
jgi:copper transport protein